MNNSIYRFSTLILLLSIVVLSFGGNDDLEKTFLDDNQIISIPENVVSDSALNSPSFRWETDIRPVFESIIKISEFEIFRKKKSLGVTFDKSLIPPEKIAQDSFSYKIASILVEKQSLILPLTAIFLPNQKSVSYLFSSNDGTVAGYIFHEYDLNGRILQITDAQIIKKYYIDALLNNPLALRLIMPSIHAVLESEGIVCPDCPGPTTEPQEKTLNFSDLINYIIYSSQLFVSETGDLQLRINRIPVDTVSNLVDFDIDLSIAVQLIHDDNSPADYQIKLILEESIASENYINNKANWNEEESLAYIKSYYYENLPKNENYLSIIKARALKILPQLNIICIDCGPKTTE